MGVRYFKELVKDIFYPKDYSCVFCKWPLEKEYLCIMCKDRLIAFAYTHLIKYTYKNTSLSLWFRQ